MQIAMCDDDRVFLERFCVQVKELERRRWAGVCGRDGFWRQLAYRANLGFVNTHNDNSTIFRLQKSGA